MYWQVYLHKTGVVAEQLLVKLLKRARILSQQGVVMDASESLNYFLNRKKGALSAGELELFALLDDYDVISAMKAWTTSDDFVLSELSKMILNRDLLKIKLGNKRFDKDKLSKKKEQLMKRFKISGEEASYFVFDGHISNRAYDTRGENINLLLKNGEITDVAEASDQLNIKALSEVVTKYFICYPKLD
jgi:HD superfamily phosphohydrolase